MFCTNCGKEIDDKAVVCVNCGVATGNFVAPGIVNAGLNNEQKKVNGLGVAGFVVGLVSLWLGVIFCIAPIVGLILSIFGMINRPKCNSCNGLAIAGLVLSIIAFVLWILYWIILGATMCVPYGI
ncbi:MAG: zinc-ribbon domain-containing protein [Clostridiales bacterium]|nr:zinc-ribbon domain-containing protein [Clostridiales bacterium]